MTKTVLIPWSGGADSTALMIKALKEDYTILYSHLQAGQSKGAFLHEKQVISRLVKKLKTLFPEKRFRPVYSGLGVNFSATSMPFKQMPAWILHAMSLCAGHSGVQEVWIGYVLGDDAVGSIPYLKETWRNLYMAMYGSEAVPPELKFPFVVTRKSEIYQMLSNNHLDELVWYCELPQTDKETGEVSPCAYCPSCVRHQQTLDDRIHQREFRNRYIDLALNSQGYQTPEERSTDPEVMELEHEPV